MERQNLWLRLTVTLTVNDVAKSIVSRNKLCNTSSDSMNLTEYCIPYQDTCISVFQELKVEFTGGLLEEMRSNNRR